MKSRFKIIGIGVMLFCVYSIAQADTELENAALARVVQVLNSLGPLINEAERQQDQNTHIQFQYDALRSDLNKIKDGIHQKLQPPSVEPRTVAPIEGDYLTLKGKQHEP